jgi:hypothetical protein
MVMRADNGLHRTQPVESHALPVAATEDAQDWSGFENWMEGHKALLRDEFCRSTGEALGTIARDLDRTIAVQAKRINELELRVAEAIGAINILRGKGAPGSFNIKGTFDPDATYNYLDVCMHGGSSWVATKDRPGELPGDGWQLLASAGARGRRGERGLPGPRSLEAPTWRSVNFDARRLAFAVTLSDGSPGPVVNLALIFASVDLDPATIRSFSKCSTVASCDSACAACSKDFSTK